MRTHTSEESAPGRPVAIITGAGSGIGAAVAARLLTRGWRLIITGRREEPLTRVSVGSDAIAVPGDVRSEDHSRRLVERAENEFGRLDGLVLSAGVSLPGTVEDTTREVWEEVIGTNLTGPFLLCREALPHLRTSRGAIVAVGSISATVAGPALAAYGVAKAGLVRLMSSIAVDHGPSGVRANSVNPGWTRSEMADAELLPLIGQLGQDLESVYSAVVQHVPARRAGSVAEVAAAVVWLLSDEASFVNGAALIVDGGTSIVDVGSVAFD